MTANLSSAYDYTDLQGLAQLRAAAAKQSSEAAREVARQFEAVLVQMMLKSMRQASGEGGLMDNDQSRLYQELFDQQVALQLAKQSGIGLAQTLEAQLGSEVAAAAPTSAPASSAEMPAAAETLAPEPPAAQPPTAQPAAGSLVAEPSAPIPEPGATGPGPDWCPKSPEAFIRDLWPHANRAAKNIGVAPEVLIAQAALETGWGQKAIRRADGGSSFNLFGVKAGQRWPGERVTVPTLEYVDGIAVRERAPFRAYDSIAASMEDYVNLLQGSARYRPALEAAADPSQFVRELQRAGYATDPAYAKKIEAIMAGDGFADTIADLKVSA